MEKGEKPRRANGESFDKMWQMLLGVSFAIVVDIAVLWWVDFWPVLVVSKLMHAAFWIKAGSLHFTNRKLLLGLVSFLPAGEAIVLVSGIMEIVLGVLFLVPSLCNLCSWSLIALLIAVFPANINCAISPSVQKATGWSRQRALGRLPMQFIFIAWTYCFINQSFTDTFPFL